MRGVVELSFNTEPDQVIDGREKRGESLTGPGWSRDESVTLFLDLGPRFYLWLGGRRKAPGKPARYCWMENFQVRKGKTL